MMSRPRPRQVMPMTTQVASPAVVRSGRAHRVPVPRDEPLIGDAAYDYADSFEVRVPESDERSMEEFVRCAIEDAPRSLRELVWLVHRDVLRLRLGPRSSASHVLGWRIKTSERDVFRLEATSPLFGRGMALDALTYVALGGLYGASLYIARAPDPKTARADVDRVLETLIGGLLGGATM